MTKSFMHMKLQCFKTKWGFEGDFVSFALAARSEGYDGLEAPVPVDSPGQGVVKAAMADNGLKLVAEICTGGSYVPDRSLTVDQHIEDFKFKYEAALAVQPVKVNCMAGCDAWSYTQSVDFFGHLLEFVGSSEVETNFETHRSRILFNPWIARDLALALPDLHFTCDFSHWCVVLERLLDTEQESMDVVYARARHIHARVGYDQHAAVPHPAAPEYAYALEAHQRWWEQIWTVLKKADVAYATLTPEFGPDGYQHRLPFVDSPIGNLAQINKWMMDHERVHFSDWAARDGASSSEVSR